VRGLTGFNWGPEVECGWHCNIGGWRRCDVLRLPYWYDYRHPHHLRSGCFSIRRERFVQNTQPLTMPRTSHISMVYPSYTRFSHALEHMTLSSKSVLIKCCQAQAFPTTQPSVLHSLLSKEPPVIIPSYQNYLPAGTHTLIDILKSVEFNPYFMYSD